MKRREFCAAGAAALAASLLPPRRARAGAPDLAAVGLDGHKFNLPGGDVEQLRAVFRGEIILPGEGSYDGARRLWNAAFDRKPAIIARCAGAADAAQAVKFAAAHGLLTAVRGGAHSLSGQSGVDGGIVIDMSLMRSVEVDPEAKEARVESGALLGQLDREAQAFGLATTVGTVADTGVSGLTLGGGVGRIGRRFGLTCDNVKRFELVTADGQWLRASASENPDLFWALRGGGGNFGVVTGFLFELHECSPQMYGGSLTYPLKDARKVLRQFADWISAAPDELYVDIDLGRDEKHGGTVDFDVCYSGPPERAPAVLAPLRKFGKPLQDKLAAASYTTLQGSANTPGFSRYGTYVKGGLIYGLTPQLIDAIVGYLEAVPPTLDVGIWAQHQGGAISRVAPTDSAYFGRGASHNLGIAGAWKVPSDEAERNAESVRRGWAVIEPLTRGNYINLANTDDRDARIHAAYGDNYTRLVSLKKRYDPMNLFRLNANIKPTA